MKTVRWGMIGCGAVTEVKSGPGLYKADNSQLVAITSADHAQAQSYAQRHGINKIHDNATDLINDPNIDIVYIATPPAFHKAYALECAQAGKMAYIEKPMAQTYADCKEIIDAFSLTHTKAYVAYYRRAMARFVKVHDLLHAGAIGALRFVNVTMYQRPDPEDYNRDNLPWRLIPKIAGGGKFLDMGIHVMDFLDYACGPLLNVSGKASNQADLYEVEDMVTATWQFANGAHGSGNWCFNSFKNDDEIVFIGEKGKISFCFFAPSSICLETADGIQTLDYPDPEHVQQPFIQSIVDELLGKSACPGDLASAARASAVMDIILRDYRKEKKFDQQFGWH